MLDGGLHIIIVNITGGLHIIILLVGRSGDFVLELDQYVI